MPEQHLKRSKTILPSENNQEIDLRDILNLIKSNYKIILVTTLIFLIAGIYYAKTRPFVYRSEALIEISDGNMSGGLGGKNALAGITAMQQSSSAELETILLKSPYVLSNVVRQMGMDISVSPQYSGYFARKIAEWRKLPHDISVSALHVPNILLAKPLTLVVNSQNTYSLFTQDGKKILDGKVGMPVFGQYLSQLVQIKITTLDATPGAKFSVVKSSIIDVANALSYGLDIRSMSENSPVLGVSYIASTPESAQKLLNAVLSAAVSKNLTQKSEEAAKVLQFISQQLPLQKTRVENAEGKLNQYDFKTGVFDAKAQASLEIQNIENLNKTLETLELKKAALLQQFTPIHPIIIAANQKEKSIRHQIDKAKTALQKLPMTTQEELNLKSEIKIAGMAYNSLLINAQAMEMMKAGTISSVKILTNASYPVGPVPIKTRLYVFGSIVLGILSSLAYIFIKFVLSPVVEDPDEVEDKLGISVLAVIPYSQKQLLHNKKAQRDTQYNDKHPFLLAQHYSKDVAIESIRSLRTAVQMALLESSGNIVAITGCRPGIGKSFISSNLSAVISDLDKRVLLIDSDMRLGKLQQSFGKSKAPGLADYLQDKANVSDIIQHAITQKLDLISCGNYPENPSELLSKPALSDLLQLLKPQYDLIIIDTPPILAVTDASLILRLCNINLLALAIGKDQLKEVQHAVNILEKSGVNLTGIVFNTLMPPKPGTAYAKYSYHYAYDK